MTDSEDDDEGPPPLVDDSSDDEELPPLVTDDELGCMAPVHDGTGWSSVECTMFVLIFGFVWRLWAVDAVSCQYLHRGQ